MDKIKAISAHIPRDLLKEACEVSQLNQTDTLVAGLRELIRQHERQKIVSLKGKIKINFSADKCRERVRL